jgi:guanylate kinase
MKRKNCVLVIAGPSGAGKTVVATSIVAKHPEFTFLRSGTTRAKRGDAHDDEYIYYTEEEFLRAVENGEMAEHAVYNGCMYGTPNAELDRAFSEGKTPLLVIDLNGVKSLALHPKYSACNIYIYNDIDVLESRLFRRYFIDNEKPDSMKNFEQRKAQNLADWRGILDYGEYIHAFVENNATVDECCERILSIFCDYTDGSEKDEWLNNAVLNGLISSANERS